MPETKMKVKEKTVTLKDGRKITADAGITDILKELNDAGFITFASCSGMIKDHGKPESTYISFEVPTQSKSVPNILRYPYDVEIEVENYAQCLASSLEESGFIANFGRVYIIPTVSGCFHPPIPFPTEEESKEKDVYDKREERLKKNDTCYNRVLTDEEIEYRLNLLVERLESNHCKHFQEQMKKEKK
jgi:hypothetical protein